MDSKFETGTYLYDLIKKAIKYVMIGIQETNFPISYIEQNKIGNNYLKLVKGETYSKDISVKDFIGPSSVTLQMIHLLKNEDTTLNTNTISNIRNQDYDRVYSFSPGWKSIIVSMLSKSKSKSLLILQSRYKSGIFSKLIERILCKLFFNHVKIVDRNLYIMQNKSIHQSILMQELVKQSGLNILDNEVINNFFHPEPV